MEAVLLKQENKLEAFGFIEDLVNQDESAFEQLNEDDFHPPPTFEDDFHPPPTFEDPLADLIDDIIADYTADLETFNFDLNQFLEWIHRNSRCAVPE